MGELVLDLDSYLRAEIERLFGSVDPHVYDVAYFDADGERRVFDVYAVWAQDEFDVVTELVRAIRHDARKVEGGPIANDKCECRLAWRMLPVITPDEHGGYCALCRLVYWPQVKIVEPCHG